MHDTEPLYTVYALTDGLVEDIYDGDSIDGAYDAYVDAVVWERYVRDTTPGYTETSVHLYEPHYGIMHLETTITEN